MQPIACPKCNSFNIHSYDNEPLHHPNDKNIETTGMRFDYELYMKMQCGNCDNKFTQIFDLVPRKNK